LISTELKKSYLKRRNIAAGIAIAIMAFFILRRIAGGNAEDPWYINLLMFLYLLCYIAACWFYLKSKQRSGGWLLLIPTNIVGLIIYMCLEDRSAKPDNIPCPACQTANFPDDATCRFCKTPLFNPIPE